ncbi:MAG: Lipid-A-disaccharide synthase [Sporomusa sp.]|nr:Lipid-A-disaccharide synthase [Sporomusa sp.]
MCKIMISAGEASGDLHGASLATALKKICSNVRIFGMGGSKMREAGVEIVHDINDLATMGFIEIATSMPKLFRLRKFLSDVMDLERPDVLVIIDYPGFNMRLAKIAKAKGIPVVSYISPKVWAHGRGRAKEMANLVEHVAVIFPFEVEIYREAGANVSFIGNPLIDIAKPTLTKEEAYRYFDADPIKPVVLLMPGSRRHEIQELLPVMMSAAEKITEKIPCQFYLPIAPTIAEETIANILKEYSVPVKLSTRHTYDLMHISDIAIAASGTATLETSIMAVPTILIYKLNTITYFIAKFMVDIPYVGLANIIADRLIIPELIQHNATPDNIVKEAVALLTNKELRERILHDLDEVKSKLGEPGAVDRGAQIILDVACNKTGISLSPNIES